MFLGGEVAVGGSERDPGALGDELHLHAVYTALERELHDGLEQCLTPLQLPVSHALNRLRSDSDPSHAESVAT